MKALLLEYATYNLWANEAVSDSLNLLSHEQHHALVKSSFDSLYKTVFHVRGAEKLWWQRLHKEKNITAPPDDFSGSMKALTLAWKQQDEALLSWVSLVDENILSEKLYYKNLKGNEFEMPIYQILHHIFNHSTYHRGQIITMMRQVGAENIPSTDFILWAIRKTQKSTN